MRKRKGKKKRGNGKAKAEKNKRKKINIDQQSLIILESMDRVSPSYFDNIKVRNKCRSSLKPYGNILL